jgi:outer membrane protein TolC
MTEEKKENLEQKVVETPVQDKKQEVVAETTEAATVEVVAEEKAEASEEQYRNLSDDMPAYITTFKPDGTILYANKKIAELQLKQIKAARYPTMRINTGYNFNESVASLGFVAQFQSRGFNYGFNATLNLFDGFAQNRNEKIAKIQIQNSKLSIDQQNLALNSQLSSSYQTYLTNLELIILEEKNEQIAKQNLNITLDKFRIGTITTLEFRTAQLNYVNAKVRFSNAQFQGKLSEIALKELAGTITL